MGDGVVAAAGSCRPDPAAQPPAGRPRQRLDLPDHGDALCRERSPVIGRGGQLLERPAQAPGGGVELLQPNPHSRVVDVLGAPAPDRPQRPREPLEQAGTIGQHLPSPVVPVLRQLGVPRLQRCPREVRMLNHFQDQPPRRHRTRAHLRGADDPVQPGRERVHEINIERLTRPVQRPCGRHVQGPAHHGRELLDRQHRQAHVRAPTSPCPQQPSRRPPPDQVPGYVRMCSFSVMEVMSGYPDHVTATDHLPPPVGGPVHTTAAVTRRETRSW